MRLEGRPRGEGRTGAGFAAGEQFGEHADGLLSSLRNVRQPRIFVISGPSGVGKDTVIELMRPLYPDAHFAVTATTRPRRPGEIDGVHYYFLDEDTFLARKAEGEFIESAIVYGHHYGVPRSPIRTALARGEDVFIKVDVQGAASIRALVPHAVMIFLLPESMGTLLQRLRSRKSDDPDVLMNRFSTASRELESASEFDYVVFNESERVERTLDTIRAIVKAEQSRVHQREVHL